MWNLKRFFMYVLLALSFYLAANAQTRYGCDQEGNLNPGCHLFGDIRPNVKIDFVGGFTFNLKMRDGVKGKANSIVRVSEENIKYRPENPESAMQILEVSNLAYDGKEYLYLGRVLWEDGFTLSWKSNGKSAVYIAMFVLWDKLGQDHNFNSSTVCFSNKLVGKQKLSRDKILKVQSRLIASGYLDGKADGIFGRQSSSALKKTQRNLKIPVTGKLDGLTCFYFGI